MKLKSRYLTFNLIHKIGKIKISFKILAKFSRYMETAYSSLLLGIIALLFHPFRSFFRRQTFEVNIFFIQLFNGNKVQFKNATIINVIGNVFSYLFLLGIFKCIFGCLQTAIFGENHSIIPLKGLLQRFDFRTCIFPNKIFIQKINL